MDNTPTPADPEVALLGCPWCEQPASLENDGDPKYPIVIVDTHVEPCPLGFHTLQISYPDEHTAIAAWNTRHILASASAVPEGFALVPIEPTEEMVKAIWKSTLGGSMRSAERAALAMLAAALEPKEPNQ